MEAVRTSETSIDNNLTRQYNPEDSSEHQTLTCEISSSHGGEHEVESCLLGCTAV
jgi:hypothetical protein